MSKVSIITPNFNGEEFLEETILSVINQSDNNYEYIIVDGLSRDGSMKIIKRYEKKIDLVISEADNGVYDAVDKGIKKSSGDIIIWINSDDILHHHAVKNVLNIFKRCPNIKWINGCGGYIKKRQYSLFPYIYPNFFLKKGLCHHKYWGYVQQESTVFRKSLYLDAGGLDIKEEAADYHLWKKFSHFTKLYPYFVKIGYFRTRKGQLSERQKVNYQKSTGIHTNGLSFRCLRLLLSLIIFPIIFLKTIYHLKK